MKNHKLRSQRNTKKKMLISTNQSSKSKFTQTQSYSWEELMPTWDQKQKSLTLTSSKEATMSTRTWKEDCITTMSITTLPTTMSKESQCLLPDSSKRSKESKRRLMGRSRLNNITLRSLRSTSITMRWRSLKQWGSMWRDMEDLLTTFPH